MKTTRCLDFNRGKKIHKSIGNTRSINETKMYSKQNQYQLTSEKDNLEYIDVASDTVGIGGDSWVIEEASNITITIAGYDNQCTIQD